MARAYYRALTRRTPFILLDEPTSALDDATEQRVIRGWRELAAAGYTLIVITHREAVRGAADAVVHLDASRESASAADVMGAAAAAGTMSAEAGA
jgi:ATP-binding cassette subfamily C protein CydD